MTMPLFFGGAIGLIVFTLGLVILLLAARFVFSASAWGITSLGTVFRRPPSARHPLMWLYAAMLGYLLFGVLYADFAAVPALVAHRWHDAYALRTLNNTLLFAVLAAANLPLLPLLRRKAEQDSVWLGTVWCVWRVLWGVFFAALLLSLLAKNSVFGGYYAAFADAPWPWRQSVLTLLEADGAHTARLLAQPQLRNGLTAWADGLLMSAANLPFFLLYAETLPPSHDAAKTGRHRIDILARRRRPSEKPE
ncbi:hypothetical protein HMPREF9120_00697 [Neisseria sp. oral taxon 020 str. F0370]|uniref:hypothetical protein n=1 Tax=unclassified Neisseria TaxID=2623750 RepID=UPI0002A20230|nr:MULTISPECIES: hypothetical protein [unclassified Neisseria]EKY08576.1 hypothetical protein HMPREF9120_00697 [Neisseria sp. oral taxon 020 str. F0370]